MKNTKTEKRFVTMSIPGRDVNGSDTAWFVYDRWQAGTGRAVRCESYEAARKMARSLNSK